MNTLTMNDSCGIRSTGRYTGQHGLTLIELMVSVTLGLVLLAGIVQLFVHNKIGYQIQEGVNTMQENARYAMRELTYSLRMADHWGGVKSPDVSGSPTVTGIGSCNAAWIINVNEGFRGYEGAASSPLPTDCIDTADYLPNTDVLVVRYAASDFVKTASLDANTIYVRSAEGRRAMLFKGSGVAGLPGDLYDADDEDAAGLYNYPYKVEVYFIRPCSKPAGANCADTDDNGSPIPTLSRLTLNGTTLTGPEPVIEGIEQMQLEYGIDGDNNTEPDFYANTAGDWSDVVTVRLGLIVRANDVDANFTETDPYAMPGGYSHTVPASASHYRRKLFTTVAQIRNRSRL